MYHNIECFELGTDDCEIKDCFYNSSICCFGDELVYYWFTSTNYNFNLIIPMTKQETGKKKKLQLQREIRGISHFGEIHKKWLNL